MFKCFPFNHKGFSPPFSRLVSPLPQIFLFLVFALAGLGGGMYPLDSCNPWQSLAFVTYFISILSNSQLKMQRSSLFNTVINYLLRSLFIIILISSPKHLEVSLKEKGRVLCRFIFSSVVSSIYLMTHRTFLRNSLVQFNCRFY